MPENDDTEGAPNQPGQAFRGRGAAMEWHDNGFINRAFRGIPDDEAVCMARPYSDTQFEQYKQCKGIAPGDIEPPRPWHQVRPDAAFMEDPGAWYVCISTVLQTDQYTLKRRKNDIQTTHCIVLDDLGTKIDWGVLGNGDEWIVQPHWVIETSPSNYQVGFLIEPVNDPVKVSATIHALAEAGLTDSGAQGANRVVRLPGSLNSKPEVIKANGGEPFKSVLRREYWEYPRHDLGELLTAFGITIASDPGKGNGQTEWTESRRAEHDEVLDWMRKVGWVICEGGDWIDICCPRGREHAADPRPEAGYRPLDEAGSRAFRCHHSHGKDYSTDEFLADVHKAGGPLIESYEQLFERLNRKADDKGKPNDNDDTTAPEDTSGLDALDKAVADLAKLNELHYQKVRKQQAKALGISVGSLDKAVSKARGPRIKTEYDNDATGQGLTFDDVEPWPDPVDGPALLAEITATIRRFIIMPEQSAETLALWVVLTWNVDAFDILPMALVTSPVKQCGKSNCKRLIEKLVFRPLGTNSITPAALYRVVQEFSPCLLIDEADSFLKDNDEMRGILNSGLYRNEKVTRTEKVGDKFVVRQYSTFSPKLLAMIGYPSATILDRCLVIPLKRKMKQEQVERFRHRLSFDRLKQKLKRWCDDHRDALISADPVIPKELENRPADLWEPLFAIADQVGGDWPEHARKMATALSALDNEETLSVELLSDIRDVFELLENPETITTEKLLNQLHLMEDRPWATYGRIGKGLGAHQLGRLLRGFRVRSKTVPGGTPNSRKKGFARDVFFDAWQRYL